VTDLTFTIDSTNAPERVLAVTITGVYNFGFAGRDQASVHAHVSELKDRGVPAPAIVPALYPLGADGATTQARISVFGDQTFGEVEFALINSSAGWLVTVASDHTDALVETVSVSRAKRSCPDVVADRAWLLADVADHFDDLELVAECASTGTGATTEVQRGHCGALLPPAALQKIWTQRVGRTPPIGTLILSGTIGGELPLGMEAWHMRLHDPSRPADLHLAYHVDSFPDEIAGG
jgi:hypothetical protein